MKKIFFLLFILLACPARTNAAHKHLEKWYQKKWCDAHNGEMEVIMPDHTRCDCLTNTHAIELDFGAKWAESIGQSLYYGLQTGKIPGVVLILEQDTDRKYWIRLNSTIQYYGLPIDTWETNEDEFQAHHYGKAILPWLHLLLK